MRVRRLAWAGVEITSGSSRLLLDPLEDDRPLHGFLGRPRMPLPPVQLNDATWAAVTHLHPDHCDRALLRRLPARHAICHAPIAEPLTREGLTTTPARLWEPIDAGPFRLTAVPSHDWRGDDQIAWTVEARGRRLIHCGDTIWHGRWYEIARRFESFDLALLPINAVTARLPGFAPTSVPASLTPEQAIEAAFVLRADRACAIHHGLFHNPPGYVEADAVVTRFRHAAEDRGIEALTPGDGEAVAGWE